MNENDGFYQFFLSEEKEQFQIPVEQLKKDDEMDENNIFEPMEPEEPAKDENAEIRYYATKIDELMNSLERIRAAL